jgi:uroporphyrinogen decarboxylase
MPKETMTSRERWLATLRRQKPDRIPLDYWGTAEVADKLMKHLGCSSLDEVHQKLHIDRPVKIEPKYIGPAIPKGKDVFGTEFRVVDYGTGSYEECITHPLAEFTSVEEIEKNYRWPTADMWDCSVAREQIKGKEHRAVQGGGSEPFMVYKELRGDMQGMMDMVMNPEIVHYCMGKLFDLAYERTRRIFEAIPGQVTYCYIAEDLGSQENLMYSPDHIREFIFPGMKRMIKLAKEAGAFVFHHDDGAIRKILPELIELGIDILNPIQWRCPGMEREGLKKDFGSKLIFHGGMDNQHTLPFGTVAEVEQEVLDNLRILGAGGGYVLAPCHNLQAVSPVENIVRMYEVAYNNSWTK